MKFAEGNCLFVNTTQSGLQGLILVFGKLGYDDAGHQFVEVPAWFEILWENSK